MMKAAVFDMDGLMFDTEAVSSMAWDYAGEKMGLGKIGGYMILKVMCLGGERRRQVCCQEFGEDFDISVLDRYLAEFRKDYFATHPVPVKKGLYNLLDYLKEKGYRLAVATSTSRGRAENYLKDAGVIDYFDVVIYGDMVERSKPDPDIYLKACGQLGEKPEDCYAFEDSRYGVMSAHKAGCRPLMVPDLWKPDDAIRQLAEGIFPDLDAVKDYLIEQEGAEG